MVVKRTQVVRQTQKPRIRQRTAKRFQIFLKLFPRGVLGWFVSWANFIIPCDVHSGNRNGVHLDFFNRNSPVHGDTCRCDAGSFFLACFFLLKSFERRTRLVRHFHPRQTSDVCNGQSGFAASHHFPSAFFITFATYSSYAASCPVTAKRSPDAVMPQPSPFRVGSNPSVNVFASLSFCSTVFMCPPKMF